MTRPPANPRRRRALLGAALLALVVGFVLSRAPEALKPILPSPNGAEPAAEELEGQRALLESVAPHTTSISTEVRCRSPMFTQSGEIGTLFVHAEYPFQGIQSFDKIPVYDQTTRFSAPFGETEATFALSGGDAFVLNWPLGKPGEVADCTSIERVARSVKVSGTVQLPTGEAAPNALIRCGDVYDWSDVSGRFSIELWLSLDGAPCVLSASYQHGWSEARSEAVELSLQSAHDALTLTIPEYPQWTPPEGVSAEEACQLAAGLRAYWREERRPRSIAEGVATARHHNDLGSIVEHIFRPGVVAEANLALSRMPPPCDEKNAGR
jgi:hypothetical protein